MRNLFMASLALAAIAATTACGGREVTHEDAHAEQTASAAHDEGVPHDQIPERARVAATVAREIDSRPDEAAEILASHEMTAESFEALMYEIAADPELSRAYEAARSE